MALVVLATIALSALVIGAFARGSVFLALGAILAVPLVIVLIARGAARYRKQRAHDFRDRAKLAR